MMRARRLAYVLLAPLVVACIAYAAWQPFSATAADCLQSSQLQQWGSPATPGEVPVLFVHGITGSPAIWQVKELNGAASIKDRVSSIQGASVWAFDYAKWSLDWVTDSHIGPSLAKAIACLSNATGRRVIVIAHSMGGLATQYAAAQPDGGATVAAHIAEVITLGTPFAGSKMLSAVQIAIKGGEDLTDPEVAAGAEALLSACAGIGEAQLARASTNPCFIVSVARSPVGSALEYHSHQIAELPAWNPAVRVKDIAGNSEVKLGIWLAHVTFDIGDVAVTAASATAHNTDGTPYNPVCHDRLQDILPLHLSSWCYHGHLPSNPAIVAYVVRLVEQRVTAQRPARPTPPPPTTSTTSTTTPTVSSTSQTQSEPSSLAIGSPFDDTCVVAWPTAPVRTSNSIEMTMSCEHVPESEYLFTDVTYGDPNLPVTPARATAHIVGRIVDVATSGLGYKELVVEATSVQLENTYP
jgi:pimeloyl-ACP methyl ester carboxylesterase